MTAQVRRERRETLKKYILQCVQDDGISFADLKSGAALDRLLKRLSGDLKAVMAELGAQGGANLLQLGASLLAGLASGFARR